MPQHQPFQSGTPGSATVHLLGHVLKVFLVEGSEDQYDVSCNCGEQLGRHERHQAFSVAFNHGRNKLRG